MKKILKKGENEDNGNSKEEIKSLDSLTSNNKKENNKFTVENDIYKGSENVKKDFFDKKKI